MQNEPVQQFIGTLETLRETLLLVKTHEKGEKVNRENSSLLPTSLNNLKR